MTNCSKILIAVVGCSVGTWSGLSIMKNRKARKLEQAMKEARVKELKHQMHVLEVARWNALKDQFEQRKPS